MLLLSAVKDTEAWGTVLLCPILYHWQASWLLTIRAWPQQSNSGQQVLSVTSLHTAQSRTQENNLDGFQQTHLLRNISSFYGYSPLKIHHAPIGFPWLEKGQIKECLSVEAKGRPGSPLLSPGTQGAPVLFQTDTRERRWPIDRTRGTSGCGGSPFSEPILPLLGRWRDGESQFVLGAAVDEASSFGPGWGWPNRSGKGMHGPFPPWRGLTLCAKDYLIQEQENRC